MDKFGYFAFLAPLLIFWQQGRNFITQILSLFIRNDELHFTYQNSFISYMRNNFKEIKFGNLVYKGWNSYLLSHKKYLDCIYVFQKRYIFLYKGWIPILITANSNKSNITYFNLFNFQAILKNYISKFHEHILSQDDKYFYINEIKGRSLKEAGLNFTQQTLSTGSPAPNPAESSNTLDFNFQYLNSHPPIGFKLDEIASGEPQSNKSKYYFSEQGLKVLNTVNNWVNSKEWYADRQINWRRGILLYGQPGTGKSELILQIARKLKLVINIIKISTMDDQEFSTKMMELSYGSIVLIEDIDCLWNGRVAIAPNTLSYDCFLNKLSGVDCLKNCFLFITTNYIDKLDEALLRSGRLDEQIELGNLCRAGKEFIAERMLDDWPEIQYKVVEEAGDCTAAAFENICTTEALNHYWNTNI